MLMVAVGGSLSEETWCWHESRPQRMMPALELRQCTKRSVDSYNEWIAGNVVIDNGTTFGVCCTTIDGSLTATSGNAAGIIDSGNLVVNGDVTLTTAQTTV